MLCLFEWNSSINPLNLNRNVTIGIKDYCKPLYSRAAILSLAY